MASSGQQKSCVACENGVATCTGCEKRFCLPHFTQHRQELDERMNEVVHEHNQLRKALDQQATAPHLLSRIDQWEQTSIQKIKETAKQARADLQTCFDRTKHQLINSLDNMASRLKSTQAINLYAEKELDASVQQLKQLRQMFEMPTGIDIADYNAKGSSISMIKVTEKKHFVCRFIGCRHATLLASMSAT
ncbi:unnamed protein product [Rotaria sordida]|uniref:Uncharacterized protein n=1 Tax=Rotaria sordida TaxID=392033 RepID=A0A814XPF0_9BILA|nr:unnamed protein product [Rotaria sordida]CAF1215607.1 unnamed protein product [Rotaria sordida]